MKQDHQAYGARRAAGPVGYPYPDKLDLATSAEVFTRAASHIPVRYPFSGYGIVTCAGGRKYLPNVYINVRFIREVLKIDWPIEVWYLGRQELHGKTRSNVTELFEPFGVTWVDGREVRKDHPARILNGFELKPYAIKWSAFRHVMFIDADSFPVRDFRFLFETKEYADNGAIFWPDYHRLKPANSIWKATGLTYVNEPEIESGEICIDKARCWRELCLAVWMNEYSDFFYKMVHGDKETFHLSWRKTGKPYGFGPTLVNLGNFCMQQNWHDGRPLFQHRNMDKYRLDEWTPKADSRFLNLDVHLRFLDELRAKLDFDGA